MTQIKHKTVLITGGASGIGKLMGEACLNKGATSLIVWDINQQALDDFIQQNHQFESSIHPFKVDVSDATQIQQYAQHILESIGPVDILINNAGIVVGKPFHEHSDKDVSNTLNINVQGVLETTRCFLPTMIQQNEGHIVNIASAVSLMANPNMSVYAASKWAVFGWSESLRLELKEMESSVRVTAVMPSYIDTGMFEGAKAPLFTPMLKPNHIVDAIIQGIGKNKIYVRKPFMVKLVPFVKGILPRPIFDWMAGNILGVYKSMDQFKGRNP